MPSLVEKVCFSACLLLPSDILEFIIMHLLLVWYWSEKRQCWPTFLTMGLAWLESHMGSVCWFPPTKCTVLMAGAWLDETPSPSPLAGSAPSVAGGSVKSPCQVRKKLGWPDNRSRILWSDENFLFSITVPSSHLAAHLIQLIQSLSFLWHQKWL